jgi:excisionase family DNA binding protein
MADTPSTESTPTSEPGPNRAERRHGQLVTVRYAADYLGVHPFTIRRYITQGRLRGYRTGPKLWRIDLDSLHALVVPA